MKAEEIRNSVLRHGDFRCQEHGCEGAALKDLADYLREIAACQSEKVELLRESVELQRIQHQEFMREVARKSALLDAFEKEQAEITKSVREDGE